MPGFAETSAALFTIERDRNEWGGHLYAVVDGKRIAHLEFETNELDPAGTAFIASVSVHEAFRRKGVASALADDLYLTLGLYPTFAGPGDGNSEDGEAWIEAYIAERDRDYATPPEFDGTEKEVGE